MNGGGYMSKLEIKGRGLLYEPEYEDEVIILFGLLIPYLEDDFVIDQYRGSFPDCLAFRNGQKIGIEFEVLSSSFFDHRHHEDIDNLKKCNLIICWENDMPQKTIINGGKKFLKISENHQIELIILKEVIKSLEEKKTPKFILKGKRPDLERVNKERFFAQLRDNVGKQKYNWIMKLYEFVKQHKEFEIKWSQGKRWFTMRFYVKNWNVNPIGIQGDGSIWIGYAGNPAITPWELPHETQKVLRQIFKHKEQKWPMIPLNNQDDLDKVKKAIKILAEHSKQFDIIQHKKENDP